MHKELSQLFDESIQLELNVAGLYTIFQGAFPDDAFFWGKLVVEEKNHASLIRDGKLRFQPLDKFPLEMLASSLEELRSANSTIVKLLEKHQDTPPSREDAFNLALKLEQSAGEIHFQQFMEKSSTSKLDSIFQRLNRDDKDHAMRIRSYMKDHAIEIKE